MKRREQHVLAPAKINLHLRVVGRRADAYHLLDSLVVPISLYDKLVIRVTPYPSARNTEPQIRVTSDSDAVPSGPTNLAYRAAALLLASVTLPPDVDIHINKRIPPGSGLGGGSSDAATVLLALNRLLGLRMETHGLARMAAQIGADVSFFVYGRPARIQGIGEQVTLLGPCPGLSLVVCSDRYVLSTKLVYSRVSPSLTSASSLSNIPELISGGMPISELLVNDLETAAVEIHPELLALKAKLVEQGALGAAMTGSGSAVFGVWPDSQSAQCAAAWLREQGLWAEAVRSLDISPAVVG